MAQASKTMAQNSWGPTSIPGHIRQDCEKPLDPVGQEIQAVLMTTSTGASDDHCKLHSSPEGPRRASVFVIVPLEPSLPSWCPQLCQWNPSSPYGFLPDSLIPFFLSVSPT